MMQESDKKVQELTEAQGVLESRVAQSDQALAHASGRCETLEQRAEVAEAAAERESSKSVELSVELSQERSKRESAESASAVIEEQLNKARSELQDVQARLETVQAEAASQRALKEVISGSVRG